MNADLVCVCVLTRMEVDVSGFGHLGGHTLAALLLPVGSLSYQVPANFLTLLWFDLPEWNARAGCAAQMKERRVKMCVRVCARGGEGNQSPNKPRAESTNSLLPAPL